MWLVSNNCKLHYLILSINSMFADIFLFSWAPNHISSKHYPLPKKCRAIISLLYMIWYDSRVVLVYNETDFYLLFWPFFQPLQSISPKSLTDIRGILDSHLSCGLLSGTWNWKWLLIVTFQMNCSIYFMGGMDDHSIDSL